MLEMFAGLLFWMTDRRKDDRRKNEDVDHHVERRNVCKANLKKHTPKSAQVLAINSIDRLNATIARQIEKRHIK